MSITQSKVRITVHTTPCKYCSTVVMLAFDREYTVFPYKNLRGGISVTIYIGLNRKEKRKTDDSDILSMHYNHLNIFKFKCWTTSIGHKIYVFPTEYLK